MKIEFEWHTNSVDRRQKEGLEKKIEKGVSDHLKSCVERDVESLVVSLQDAEAADVILKGSAFIEENGKRDEVITIRVNQGLLIECKNTAWFQPGNLIEP